MNLLCYCITCHKSQGSSFKNVFIDENAFNINSKLSYNYELNCNIDNTKEINQLKYVAYTRATDCVYVYY